jgi:putative transposase
MRRFKSVVQAQRFLGPFGLIREHFCPGRHRLSGRQYQAILDTRFVSWRNLTGIAA